MTELTISEARDHFSALIANLESGRESEYVIKNRSIPVARLTPAANTNDVSKRVGLFKDCPLLLDDEWFDETGDDIASLFGVER